MAIDPSAAPVGRDASATVRAADLLGEKYVDLVPGNRRDPAPSGATIPIARTGLGVELDDVLNSLDPPTRDMLRAFLNETGAAFAGRGQDLASLLAVLPPSLDQTRQLLSQLAQNNAALGNLVSESDRVVESVTAQRKPLTQLVGSAASTLQTLASKRPQLAATVADAPATLSALRTALGSLEGAAIPLGPAAQGLARTAPPLTATLRQLPSLAADARPTLATIRQITPTLMELTRHGTPVVRRLAPLTSQLASFSSTLRPVTGMLDQGIGNVLGLMEGWSRATQARDAASHVFRFGLTISPATFGSLAPLFATTSKRRTSARQPSLRSLLAPLATPAPAPTAPAAPATNPVAKVLAPVKGAVGGVSRLTAPLTGAASNVASTVTHTLQQLGLGAGSPAGSSTSPSQRSLQQLLNYLLR
jgi:phospholipid/cholesterol/gamma-HCH transport system substrate-binding protein